MAVLFLAAWAALAGAHTPETPPARSRRPLAAALLADGQTLCVANQRSGTLSLVDLRQGRPVDEVAVGQRLAGLAVLPDRKHVLVIDEQRHELLVLFLDGIGFFRLNQQGKIELEREFFDLEYFIAELQK